MPQPNPSLPDAHPGFWRVPAGMLIEAGDTWVDARGTPQPLPLERVGQPVAKESVVLRVERRRLPR